MGYHKDMTGEDLHGTRTDQIVGSPIGNRTPSVIGETVIDTETQVLYTAIGLTDQDWLSVGGVGGVPNLGGLPDVDTTNRVDQTYLLWNGTKYEHEKLVNITSLVYVYSGGSDTEGNGSPEHPYASIDKALETVTDSSSLNRYTILVSSGVYEIDNTAGPLQLKPFCNITASGVRSTIITPKDPTQSFFLGALFSYFTGIVFSGNTGNSFVLELQSAVTMGAFDCVLRDCSNGFELNNADCFLEIKMLAVNNPTGTTTNRVYSVLTGSLSCTDIIFRKTARVTTGYYLTGPDSVCQVVNMQSDSPTVATLFDARDGSVLISSTGSLRYANDGIVVSGDNTLVELQGFTIRYCTNDGLRIEETGTGIKVYLSSVTILDCNLNFNVLNTDCLIVGSGISELNKSYASSGARFFASLIDTAEDDEGNNILGELHVGTPARPSESVFGEGDSYTRGMLVYSYSNPTFTDITEQASSASGSSFSFPGITSDHALFFGSKVINITGNKIIHHGLKSKLITPADMGSGEFIFEYWNGSTWVPFNTMETESGGRYFSHNKTLFEFSGSHHIRYDKSIQEDWSMNDPMSLGEVYFWTRVTVSGTLVSPPVFEQIKLHSSRAELNSDGWHEKFGNARSYKTLNWDIGLFQAANSSPGNSDVYLSENLGIGRIENAFVNGLTDRSGFVSQVPFDIDTSTPIQLVVHFTSSETGGSTTFNIRWAKSNKGSTVLTTDTVPVAEGEHLLSFSHDNVVPAGTQDYFSVNLDVSEFTAQPPEGVSDFIWLTIERQGGIDTHTGTISLINVSAQYLTWCDGGHV